MTDQNVGVQTVPAKLLLSLLSFAYRCLLVFRKAFFGAGIFRSYHLQRPVVSIGNITVGGSGKTPLIATIAEHLQSRKLKPAVLMRGYGGKAQPQNKTVSNDESILLGELLDDVRCCKN